MPELVPIPLASSDRILAAALLAMVIIVVASGTLALIMVARARLKRNIARTRAKPKLIPDAWAESGRRLRVPPEDRPPGTEDNPDDDGNDDDDDDGDQPRPVAPSSPEISASL